MAIHIATCTISVDISGENQPIKVTFFSTKSKNKPFFRNNINYGQKIGVKHEEIVLLKCLLPCFLGRFLAREMGWDVVHRKLSVDTRDARGVNPA